MPQQSFILNGKRVQVDVSGDVRLLWVLRDVLGVTGPKYGCGLGVCQACTCLWNGLAINTCSVPVGDLTPNDEITTIEGLSPAGGPLHPMQQAWLDWDVAECGYCQPGQIMAAIAKVNQARRTGTTLDDSSFDQIRNVCRCATYSRIRQATLEGARLMAAAGTQAVHATAAGPASSTAAAELTGTPNTTAAEPSSVAPLAVGAIAVGGAAAVARRRRRQT